MRSILRVLSISIIVILVAGMLAACDGGTPPPPEPNEPLKVGWNFWLGFFPMPIALEKGFFEKHGLEVESIFFEDYDKLLSTLQVNETDASLMTLTDALLIDGRVPDTVRVVMVIDTSDGADVVLGAADIAGPSDLKGRAIGVGLGTFSELLVQEMLKQHGLTTDDVTMIYMDASDVPDSIPDIVQAGQTWEPFVSEGIEKGHHPIFTSAETPGLIADVLVVRTEVTQERPEDIKAFIAGWNEAVTWWEANPEEGNAIVAEALGIDIEEVTTEGIRLLTLEENRITFKEGDDTSSLPVSSQVNADFLIQNGVLNTAPDIDRLLDDSFLSE